MPIEEVVTVRKCFTHDLQFDSKEGFEQHLREIEHEYDVNSICQRCNTGERIKKKFTIKLGEREKFPKTYCDSCLQDIKNAK